VEAALLQHTLVHAIAGVSDGSLVAAAVATRTNSLQCYLNFCSGPASTLLPPGEHLRLRVRVPSLHLIGRADELYTAAELMEVPERCDHASIVRHQFGHGVPPMGGALASRVSGFLQRAVTTPAAFDAAGGRVTTITIEPQELSRPGKLPMEDDDSPPVDSMALFGRAHDRNDNGIIGHVHSAMMFFVLWGHHHNRLGPTARGSVGADGVRVEIAVRQGAARYEPPLTFDLLFDVLTEPSDGVMLLPFMLMGAVDAYDRTPLSAASLRSKIGKPLLLTLAIHLLDKNVAMIPSEYCDAKCKESIHWTFLECWFLTALIYVRLFNAIMITFGLGPSSRAAVAVGTFLVQRSGYTKGKNGHVYLGLPSKSLTIGPPLPWWCREAHWAAYAIAPLLLRKDCTPHQWLLSLPLPSRPTKLDRAFFAWLSAWLTRCAVHVWIAVAFYVSFKEQATPRHGWGYCVRSKTDDRVPITAVSKACCKALKVDLLPSSGSGGALLVAQYFHDEVSTILVGCLMLLVWYLTRGTQPLRRRQVFAGVILISSHLFVKYDKGSKLTAQPDLAWSNERDVNLWNLLTNASLLTTWSILMLGWFLMLPRAPTWLSRIAMVPVFCYIGHSFTLDVVTRQGQRLMSWIEPDATISPGLVMPTLAMAGYVLVVMILWFVCIPLTLELSFAAWARVRWLIACLILSGSGRCRPARPTRPTGWASPQDLADRAVDAGTIALNGGLIWLVKPWRDKWSEITRRSTSCCTGLIGVLLLGASLPTLLLSPGTFIDPLLHFGSTAAIRSDVRILQAHLAWGKHSLNESSLHHESLRTLAMECGWALTTTPSPTRTARRPIARRNNETGDSEAGLKAFLRAHRVAVPPYVKGQSAKKRQQTLQDLVTTTMGREAMGSANVTDPQLASHSIARRNTSVSVSQLKAYLRAHRVAVPPHPKGQSAKKRLQTLQDLVTTTMHRAAMGSARQSANVTEARWRKRQAHKGAS